MTYSQDLVPTGQPYGARQETVAAMQQAEVPLGSQSASPAAPGGNPLPTTPPPGAPLLPAGAPMTGLDLLNGRSPADFPFLDDPNAVPLQETPPGEAASSLSALEATAQSTFALAVLQRLRAGRR